MDVQDEVLEKLVCDYCGEYLSIGPVMLLEEEKSVCGRCSAPDPKELPVLRNLPYELLAKDLLFPCQNKRHGCPTTKKFNSMKSHEAACDFRQYSCFLLETRSCEWFGTKKDVLEHCKAKHPDLLKQNPAIFEHDVIRTSVANFLMTAFNMLFLIHTKVCLQTKKIYHCVRLLGDAEDIRNYDYTLDICQERNNLSKQGNIVAQGCLSIKESESLAVGINSLIEIFNGYTGTTFKLTVNSSIKEPSDHVEELHCEKCQKIITYKLAYYVKGKWNCINCISNKQKCQFQHEGCTFTDAFNKVFKHSWFYCSYSDRCIICGESIYDSLDEHYDIAHFDITHSAGVTFTESISFHEDRCFIINSDSGKMHCTHVAYGSWFAVSISAPFDSGELHFYALNLMLQNPKSGYTTHKNIPLYNDNHIDWYIKIEASDFKQYVANDKFNLTITIKKIKNYI